MAFSTRINDEYKAFINTAKVYFNSLRLKKIVNFSIVVIGVIFYWTKSHIYVD